MNVHAHPTDAQLPLSILFLAMTDSARQEPQRAVHPKSETRTAERETAYEEPERWDGMW